MSLFTNRKVGGIRFITIGRACITLSVKRAQPAKRATRDPVRKVREAMAREDARNDHATGLALASLGMALISWTLILSA